MKLATILLPLLTPPASGNSLYNNFRKTFMKEEDIPKTPPGHHSVDIELPEGHPMNSPEGVAPPEGMEPSEGMEPPEEPERDPLIPGAHLSESADSLISYSPLYGFPIYATQNPKLLSIRVSDMAKAGCPFSERDPASPCRWRDECLCLGGGEDSDCGAIWGESRHDHFHVCMLRMWEYCLTDGAGVDEACEEEGEKLKPPDFEEQAAVWVEKKRVRDTGGDDAKVTAESVLGEAVEEL